MIRFGTSGWRGVIGEDFTFENVRIASQGVANYLKKSAQRGSGVIVAYDTRFLSEKFASEAAKILAFNGIKAFLCVRDVPTPVVSFEIIRRRAMGAINFTASHNPPEYNGLKFSTSNGAPALPEITKQIEREIHAVQQNNERLDVYEKTELIEAIDPKNRYLDELRQKVDVDIIRGSGLRIAIDSLYGTARDYLDYFLLDAGIEAKIIHNYRDPYFGGFSPECNEKNLIELREVAAAENFDLGLATDGDADRFGIIDDRHRFVPANTILALLSLYLKRERKIAGGLARSVATTHLIDAIARKLDVPVYETPVGFKFIGELILENRIALGGEESAGMSMYGHLPEKDGVLACLLVAEMVARTGKKLSQLIEELYAEFGTFLSKRVDLKLTQQLKETLAAKLDDPPRQIDGFTVRDVNTTDGVKLIFGENTWLLFRLSGTEPVGRLYAEAGSPRDLKHLLDAGRKFVAPIAQSDLRAHS
ncbi:MAG: phosphoglucomutase/phosphomannomutase family protein [Acidobacteria bacterium]|nr:phosphoglucomutase/phosphomannomutase family protein [Acidobacteriota bacterium]MBV9477905.1 phosphoglucomutase/phosphomannomutase family protein [Acidobacteriota bacterium]